MHRLLCVSTLLLGCKLKATIQRELELQVAAYMFGVTLSIYQARVAGPERCRLEVVDC